MRQFLTGVAKFFTAVFALLFVITAVLALLLFNAGQQLFNPRLYKNALVSQNVYERLPAVVSVMLTTSASVNPCLQNPVSCEDISPELKACYGQALGSDRYVTLASGQDQPTDDEKRAIQDCMDANTSGQASSQTEAGRGEGEGGMPLFMSNLEASDWENIIITLLPPADLQAMIEKTIDGLFAYLNGESNSVTISLVALKARLAGPPGTEAIQRLILSQPPCTLEELAQISDEARSESAGMVLCNPGENLTNLVLPKVQEQLKAAINTIPNHVTIIKPAPPAAVSSNPGPFGINNDPIRVLILMRMIIRLSPFLPLACLLLVTLFGVRSIKGWMRWWGIPIFITGAITLSISLTSLPLFEIVWVNFAAPRIPAFIPIDISNISHNLVYYVAHTLMEKIVLQSVILIVISLAAWIGSYFIES
jgi:hypothetical protein